MTKGAKKQNNIALVDGQNFHLATTKHPSLPWQVDLARFRIYLREKYSVSDAYYWLGYVDDNYEELYDDIQKAGFILKFREHNPAMKSNKKGNVDTDIVFEVMLRLYRRENFDGVILVSGDGDYKRLVEFLIVENKLAKVLFPNGKRASSLYRLIGNQYYDDLSKPEIRLKISAQRNQTQIGKKKRAA